jgi:GT2 family glycosyltransferase
MRPDSLIKLLNSVKQQTLYPNEILIIDGSITNETEEIIAQYSFDNLRYFLVSEENRGLTRQRNYGLSKLSTYSEVVCFLDDDTVLKSNYFEEIIKTYKSDDSIIGVGGIAINENKWIKKVSGVKYGKFKFYELDGFVHPEGIRNIARNRLGLQSDLPPGKMPQFSNSRTCGFPLNGKVYEVDLLIGMSFSFRKIVYDSIQFSTYFEGYGLYEDADYSIRALQFGKNVITTNAQLYHYHDQLGRPNKYQYGKMILRNGWYVWRLKYSKPSFTSRLKWNAIAWLLIIIRFSNIFTSNKRREAFTETAGRIIGWLSLCFSKPTISPKSKMDRHP